MTSTPPGSLPCTVETCDRTFATEHALSIHLARTHRIPGSVRKKARRSAVEQRPDSSAPAPSTPASVATSAGMTITISFGDGSIDPGKFAGLLDAIGEVINAR